MPVAHSNLVRSEKQIRLLELENESHERNLRFHVLGLLECGKHFRAHLGWARVNLEPLIFQDYLVHLEVSATNSLFLSRPVTALASSQMN